jgi:hypothetical protein
MLRIRPYFLTSPGAGYPGTCFASVLTSLLTSPGAGVPRDMLRVRPSLLTYLLPRGTWRGALLMVLTSLLTYFHTYYLPSFLTYLLPYLLTYFLTSPLVPLDS